MKLSSEIIEEIKEWNGFEDFNGKDIEVTSKAPEIFSHCEVTLLMKAIEEEDVEVVKALCVAGVNVNRVAKGTDQTPLICFDEESKKSNEIAKILIDFGADVNYLRPFDLEDDTFYYLFSSPLMNAVDLGDYERIKLLINSGANVNLSLVENGYCAISQLHPKHNDYLEILKFLIENGADVNADNSSALKMAVEVGNIKAIELLLNSGAKPDLCGQNDKTALMTLMDLMSGIDHELDEDEEEYIFNLLLSKTTDINIIDSDGKSVIFYTIESDIGTEDFNISAFFKILERDIDVNILDNEGNNILTSLLLYIEEYGYSDEYDFEIDEKRMISHLVKRGVNATHQNVDNISPSMIAKRIGNKEMIELLNTSAKVYSKENYVGEEILDSINHISKVGILTKLFKPKQIVCLLEELNIIEAEFNNKHFSIVKGIIKKSILKNSKSFIKEINNGNSNRYLIYNMVNIVAGDLFESGEYPYRTFFGDGYDSGFYLLSFYDKSLDELVKMNKLSEQKAHEQKKIIRRNMDDLISKQLPFM